MIMVDTSTASFDLELGELLALCDALVIQTLPAVLRVEERHETDSAAIELRAAGRSTLAERGVLDAMGNVHPTLKWMMQAAAHPEWMLELRRIDVTQVFRMCIVADGQHRVLVSRSGERFSFEEIRADDDAKLLVREVTARIGATAGAPITPLRFPSDVLDAALALCVDEVDYTAALFGLGVPEPQGRAVAATLSHCVGQTEIVVNNASLTDRAVLAVFDTERGRVVSLAAPSLGGERWTSIAPGDDYAVVSAVRQLAENLPGGDR